LICRGVVAAPPGQNASTPAPCPDEESDVALGLFLLVCVACAWAWHRRVSGFMSATLGATLSAVLLFQVLAFLEAGGLHPLAKVAAAMSTIPAFTIALAVGGLMRWRRRRSPGA
jgi:hypothetical protein